MKYLALFFIAAIAASTQAHVLRDNSEAPKGTSCTICQVVVNIVKQLVVNGNTEDQIIAELDKVCANLGPLAGICKNLVDNNLKQIIDHLVNGLDPNKVCGEIGLCLKSDQKSSSKAGAGCTVCEVIVNIVKQLVANGNAEQQIIAELDKVCANLGPLAGTCKTLVDTYLKQIIDHLVGGLDPAQVCGRIGLCLKKEKVVVTPAISDKAGTTCTICEVVVNIVKMLVANGQAEDEIIAELDKVCANLGPLAGICKNLVDNNLKQIIDHLLNGLDPAKVCGEIGLCIKDVKLPATVPKKPLKMTAADEKATPCQICEVIVQLVKQLIGNGATEDQIIAQLDKVCVDLGPLAGFCKNIVDNYFKQILDHLINGLEPAKVCAEIHLC